jgi:hypothetical protein
MPRPAVVQVVAIALCGAVLAKTSTAQPSGVVEVDRSTITQIVRAAFRVVRIDSLCPPRRCRTIAVDTVVRVSALEGDIDLMKLPDLPIAGAFPASVLSLLPGRGARYVAKAYENAPSPHDSARVMLFFTPPNLAALGRGSVSFVIDIPIDLGLAAVVRVERRGATWRAVGVRYIAA